MSGGLHGKRPLMDRLHVRGLFERTVAGAAPTPAVAIGAAGAQGEWIDHAHESSIDTVVDAYGAHVPTRSVSQPTTDLGGDQRWPRCLMATT